MLKRAGFGLILIAVAASLFGCATAPRRQEVPAPVVAAPPVVPAETQAELDRLKQQVAEQQAALAQSDADRRALEDKLDNALASKKPAKKKTEDSYLK